MCDCGLNHAHDHLDDDVFDIFGYVVPTNDRSVIDTTLADAQVERVLHREKCAACGGTGKFRSYSGRIVGDCFKCKGAGSKTFKTSTEQRAAAAVQRAKIAVRKAEELSLQIEQWKNENQEDYAWIVAKASSFDFAGSMLEALRRYGSLTERQHATVTRLRIADAQRNTAAQIERASREADAKAVDVSKIEAAFASALQNDIKRPKIRLAGFIFKLAPANGRNAGAIYVMNGNDQNYLGKVQGGRFIRSRECSAETESEVLAVASDPANAAVAYGRRTGECSCCGRPLTKHASIDAGIGPICAKKYGW